MAGLRIGYAIASAEITDLLNRVRQPFNTNHLAQKAALAALADQDHVARCRDINSRGLEHFSRICDALGLPYIPSAANFLTVEFGDRAQEIYEALLHKGIIVRPVGNYGMPGHLRITIGMPEDMDMLESALKQIL